MLCLAAIFLLLQSCASSMHQVNAGEFKGYGKLKRAKKVEVKHSQKYIIAKFDNKFVDDGYAKLSRACKGGKISGLTTTYYTDLSFFSFTENLVFKGYCLK